MKKLTDQQRKVLAAVADFDRENGFPPTLSELGGLVGLPNINAVRGHLAALEKKGYLTRVPDKARSIRIVHAPSTLSRLKRRLHEAFRTDEGVVHHVVYGLAWTTQGRVPRLDGPFLARMRSVVEHEAREHGWELLDAAVGPDHVAVTVRVWPNHSPRATVERFKKAGVAMFRRHARGGRLPRIWDRGYAVTTDPALLSELVAELLGREPVPA